MQWKRIIRTYVLTFIQKFNKCVKQDFFSLFYYCFSNLFYHYRAYMLKLDVKLLLLNTSWLYYTKYFFRKFRLKCFQAYHINNQFVTSLWFLSIIKLLLNLKYWWKIVILEIIEGMFYVKRLIFSLNIKSQITVTFVWIFM